MARKKKGEMTPEELLEAQIKGKQGAVDGPAHEHIVCGILMKKYQNVSLVDLPLSPFDIILVIQNGSGQEIIRAQVRTAQKEIKFTGGTRGGQDKEYRSDVKKYTQNTTTSDVIIGVKAEEVNECFC